MLAMLSQYDNNQHTVFLHHHHIIIIWCIGQAPKVPAAYCFFHIYYYYFSTLILNSYWFQRPPCCHFCYIGFSAILTSWKTFKRFRSPQFSFNLYQMCSNDLGLISAKVVRTFIDIQKHSPVTYIQIWEQSHETGSKAISWQWFDGSTWNLRILIEMCQGSQNFSWYLITRAKTWKKDLIFTLEPFGINSLFWCHLISNMLSHQCTNIFHPLFLISSIMQKKAVWLYLRNALTFFQQTWQTPQLRFCRIWPLGAIIRFFLLLLLLFWFSIMIVISPDSLKASNVSQLKISWSPL